MTDDTMAPFSLPFDADMIYILKEVLDCNSTTAPIAEISEALIQQGATKWFDFKCQDPGDVPSWTYPIRNNYRNLTNVGVATLQFFFNYIAIHDHDDAKSYKKADFAVYYKESWKLRRDNSAAARAAPAVAAATGTTVPTGPGNNNYSASSRIISPESNAKIDIDKCHNDVAIVQDGVDDDVNVTSKESDTNNVISTEIVPVPINNSPDETEFADDQESKSKIKIDNCDNDIAIVQDDNDNDLDDTDDDNTVTVSPDESSDRNNVNPISDPIIMHDTNANTNCNNNVTANEIETTNGVDLYNDEDDDDSVVPDDLVFNDVVDLHAAADDDDDDGGDLIIELAQLILQRQTECISFTGTPSSDLMFPDHNRLFMYHDGDFEIATAATTTAERHEHLSPGIFTSLVPESELELNSSRRTDDLDEELNGDDDDNVGSVADVIINDPDLVFIEYHSPEDIAFDDEFILATITTSDDPTNFDPVTTVTFASISKRHYDSIRENLYHLQEDQRVHDSLTDSHSVSNRSCQYHVHIHNNLGNLGHILEITSMVMLQKFLLKKPIVPPPDTIATSRAKNADDDVTVADGINDDFENGFMIAAAAEHSDEPIPMLPANRSIANETFDTPIGTPQHCSQLPSNDSTNSPVPIRPELTLRSLLDAIDAVIFRPCALTVHNREYEDRTVYSPLRDSEFNVALPYSEAQRRAQYYAIPPRPSGASKENTLGRTSNINGTMISCKLEGRTIMFGKQSMDQQHRIMVTPTYPIRERSWGVWKSNIHDGKNANVISSKQKHRIATVIELATIRRRPNPSNNANISRPSLPIANATFDTTTKTPSNCPQLPSNALTTSPTQFRHELTEPSLFKVYKSIRLAAIRRRFRSSNQLVLCHGNQEKRWGVPIENKNGSHLDDEDVSITDGANAFMKKQLTFTETVFFGRVSSPYNDHSDSTQIAHVHRAVPYHRSDNDDNYDDNNNIDIIVAHGTNNLIYAKPIISTNQEERWGVSIINKMILQVDFYSFDPFAIPHRYYYHQVVTKRFIERLQQLRKVFATIVRQNQEERWGATIINTVIIKLRSTCLHPYICLMQCYFNFTHTRKRRSVASRWGVLNCEQLIVNQYS